jgi:hypothetical protein
MQRPYATAALIGVATLLLRSMAHAACIDDPRQVALDQDNVVLIKSYRCTVGDGLGAPEIKVEFYHLAENAAGLLLAKGSSTQLRKTIGSPRIVENDVFRAYTDLLKNVGTSTAVETRAAALSVGRRETGEERPVSDKFTKKTIRTLKSGDAGPIEYPAASEIGMMRKKQIPQDLHFFYSITCLDEEKDTKREDSAVCKDYDEAAGAMLFWRGMRESDLTNYAQNIAAYNRMLPQVGKNPRVDGFRTAAPSAPLRALKYLAGNEPWPEDFLILVGAHSQDGCVEPGIGGWHFDYLPRDTAVAAVLIENISPQPITITGLLGERSTAPRLRAKELASGAPAAALDPMAEKLAPGQKLLVPTAIEFTVQEDLRSQFYFRPSAADVHRKRGSSGFAGNTAGFATPIFRDYAFGPEIAVKGVSVNGIRVDLERGPASFIELVIADARGSCPYLLAWDGAQRDWTNHGKVLHRANSRELEYTETITIAGFVPRFRIEEREPEVALLDHVELAVTLGSGETLTLAAQDARLRARDGDRVQLLWGEAIELVFRLPERISEDDVVDSRLALTGFYQRYSSLMATQAPPQPADVILPRSPGATPISLQFAIAGPRLMMFRCVR